MIAVADCCTASGALNLYESVKSASPKSTILSLDGINTAESGGLELGHKWVPEVGDRGELMFFTDLYE